MPMTENLRGAALMAASMACFTINDACMKALSDDLPLFQALFLRGVATTVLMTALIRVTGGLIFRFSRRDLVIVLGRTAAEIGAAYCFVSAIFNMPFANATAIVQALPLSITLAGALFLQEVVGWRRWTAILIGFAGVLMIVQPGSAGFTWYAVYPMGAVVMVTIRDLLSRQLSVAVPSMTVAFLNAAAVAVFFGACSIFIEWAPLSTKTTLQLAAASVLLIGGYLYSVSAMRVGEIAFVSPFRYTSLLFALFIGVWIFGEIPNKLAILGALIVVATGAYTFYRERRVKPTNSMRSDRT